MALSTLASKNAFALDSSSIMALSFSGQFHWQLFVLRGAARGAVPLPAAALPLAAPAVPLAAMPLSAAALPVGAAAVALPAP